MRRKTFRRGMARLMNKGFSKRRAFGKMKALAWKNKTNYRMGNTKRSRYSAKHGLRRLSRVR